MDQGPIVLGAAHRDSPCPRELTAKWLSYNPVIRVASVADKFLFLQDIGLHTFVRMWYWQYCFQKGYTWAEV